MDLTNIKDEDLKRCAEFHGHLGAGITIGCRATKYAARLLGFELSKDADVVCVSENDGCCLDAFEVLLGCTEDKGNLQVEAGDKMAFSFCDNATGKSVKLVLKERDPQLSDEEWLERLVEGRDEELFEVTEG